MENEFENRGQLPQEPIMTEEDAPREQPEAIEIQPPQEEQQSCEPVTFDQIPRFEPSSEYRWVRPTPAERVRPLEKPAKPAKKKGFSGWKVVVLALCCSLVGGMIGAGLSALTKPNKEQNSHQSNMYEGNRESTIINVNQIDTGKQLTAAEVYAVNVNSTVGITTQVTTNFWGYQTTSAASGSGFVYTDDGYILTNYHVIEDASAISVTTYDGRSLDAELIGYDENHDIAVLKVNALKLTPVVIGDSSNLNVGDPVVAIGNPLGELTFSLTSGAVSALEREVTFSGGLTMNLIQTDCAINSGNSGGALFNLYGEVIGITNAKYSGNSNSGATIDNIGFAIPINRVRAIVDSIIEKGYAVKPYIGVTIVDVSAETQSYGLPQGASIRTIEENGPAAKSGLQINDIVTHVNGEVVTGAADFKKHVTYSTPGDVLKLTVWRKGETITLDLTIGEQNQSATKQ